MSSHDLFSPDYQYDIWGDVCPNCGDEGEIVQILAELPAEVVKRWVMERAERWRLIDFIRPHRPYYQHGDMETLIYDAWSILRDIEQHEEWLKTREGVRAIYNANRKELFKAMLARGDKKECCICGRKTRISIDHIKPIARGGGNELDNLRFLCRSCNSRKGAKDCTSSDSHPENPSSIPLRFLGVRHERQIPQAKSHQALPQQDHCWLR